MGLHYVSFFKIWIFCIQEPNLFKQKIKDNNYNLTTEKYTSHGFIKKIARPKLRAKK